jgi:hypothetical protein
MRIPLKSSKRADQHLRQHQIALLPLQKTKVMMILPLSQPIGLLRVGELETQLMKVGPMPKTCDIKMLPFSQFSNVETSNHPQMI